MEWYLAKLIYRFQPKMANDMVHFEEQIRILEAEDELHAFHKAQQIGSREESYLEKGGKNLICWHFMDVTELLKLHSMMDGAEILSQSFKTTEPELYQKDIRLKAGYLLTNCTEQFLQSR
ncbi:MAG: DUF4288 domain-containing protein [Chitinophagaceae bacterium]|nr:DUF4288 domain-containing protein [Chitinophagaceae bacterium]